jgi:hypothetical protein
MLRKKKDDFIKNMKQEQTNISRKTQVQNTFAIWGSHDEALLN